MTKQTTIVVIGALRLIFAFFSYQKHLLGIQKQVQISHGKWAISVQDIEVLLNIKVIIWAGAQHFLACVPSKNSDQPAHPCNLIRVFTGHSVGSQVSKMSSTLWKHAYSNMFKISPPKNWKFLDKNSNIFHISARGSSNEYPQSMCLSRNKKNNVYPCKSQFKLGLWGSTLYRHFFVMSRQQRLISLSRCASCAHM